MDIFILRKETAEGVRMYQQAVTKLLVSRYLAFGMIYVLDLYDIVIMMLLQTGHARLELPVAVKSTIF